MLVTSLNALVRFSLQQRVLVLVVAVVLMLGGAWQATRLPVDVFPDFNRPRVTVLIEAAGYAPEEVESLITIPLESSLQGATGVRTVRSQSSVGLAVLDVEFDWGTDIYNDRQVVTARLQSTAHRLPTGIVPELAPISSVMGQILILGLWSDVAQTTPLELRALADWVVRPRLLAVPGVSQVFVMGGQRRQFQVLVNPAELLRYDVALRDVRQALAESNMNATGGYLEEQGPHELLVRSLGRVQTVADLEGIVVKAGQGRPVLVRHVARVQEGAETKRGDSAAFVRGPDGIVAGGPAVVLTVNKQPEADTRRVTEDVQRALREVQADLPADVRIEPGLYQQRAFIDLAVANVLAALRDGALLVVVVLFLLLLNVRVTLITLTALPLSMAGTILVFAASGLSINTMTLGGLAVAIGELVDDAIVDVENIFRRLRENRLRADPRPVLEVVYQASVEIRSSIVYGTLIVVLVFVPVLALHGMEGRLFAPLAVAYVVSLVSSLFVSLTVTPALSYFLLGRGPLRGPRENWLLRGLQALAGGAVGVSVRRPRWVLALAAVLVLGSLVAASRLENDFLPPFNEGTVQINVVLPPGTSLPTSAAVARGVEQRLLALDDIQALVRRTGRAELDEHAVPVSMTEIIATLDPHSPRTRGEILATIRRALAEIPGITTSVEQPLAHLISHMLSGVQSQIAIKLYGAELPALRRGAEQIARSVADIPGLTDLQVEPQWDIPQLRIEINGDQLQKYGMRRQDINELIETALHGTVVSQMLVGQRTWDLLVRLDGPYREDLEAIKRLVVPLPGGGETMLAAVARIYPAAGPYTINREQARRRIVVQANVSGRGLVDVVGDIRDRLRADRDAVPPGCFLAFGGQFESQQSAARLIWVLMGVVLLAVFLILCALFGSANLALQVLVAIPLALVGSVAALYLTGQTLTIAAMVGFISLCGIATRNGILLLNHYLHLVRHEGESWTVDMLVRAARERVAPVVMTATTSGVGLLPLALAAGQPGKEILYPIATVIIGGLITSTLLEFLVRPALFWTCGRWIEGGGLRAEG